jgi:hypothetical protein
MLYAGQGFVTGHGFQSCRKAVYHRPRALNPAGDKPTLKLCLKTLQEPKNGPLEPFEIAGVCPYLSFFQ